MKKLFFALFLFFSFNSISLKAQELTMFSGLLGWEYYQDDKKIDKAYFKKLLSDAPAAEQSWKKANLNQGIGFGMIGVQVGFGIWMINNDEKNKSITVPAVGFAASAVSAIVFAVRSMTHRKHAILNYNRSLDKKNMGLQLAPSQQGLGLTLSF